MAYTLGNAYSTIKIQFESSKKGEAPFIFFKMFLLNEIKT